MSGTQPHLTAGQKFRIGLPLPALAALHGTPGVAATPEALNLLLATAWPEDDHLVLVMARSTQDTFTAALNEQLAFPVTPGVSSYRGVPFKVDDAVRAGTVLAYRWEEYAIIRQIREAYPHVAVYPQPEESKG